MAADLRTRVWPNRYSLFLVPALACGTSLGFRGVSGVAMHTEAEPQAAGSEGSWLRVLGEHGL